MPLRQDHARRRDIQRQAQHGCDQQNGREGREFQWLLDPQRDHQDEDRQGNRQGQADIDENWRNGQKQDRQDDDDTEGKADIPTFFLSIRPNWCDDLGVRHVALRCFDYGPEGA